MDISTTMMRRCPTVPLTWSLKEGYTRRRVWLSEKERAQVFSELHVDRAGLNTKNWKQQEMRLKRKITDNEKACPCSPNSLLAENGCRVT